MLVRAVGRMPRHARGGPSAAGRLSGGSPARSTRRPAGRLRLRPVRWRDAPFGRAHGEAGRRSARMTLDGARRPRRRDGEGMKRGLSRTRKSSLTLAAFRPWGSWARYRRARDLTPQCSRRAAASESGGLARRSAGRGRPDPPAWRMGRRSHRDARSGCGALVHSIRDVTSRVRVGSGRVDLAVHGFLLQGAAEGLGHHFCMILQAYSQGARSRSSPLVTASSADAVNKPPRPVGHEDGGVGCEAAVPGDAGDVGQGPAGAAAGGSLACALADGLGEPSGAIGWPLVGAPPDRRLNNSVSI